MKSRTLSHHFSSKAFTLTEILAVMAVMGIIIAVAIPVVRPMMRASNVNRAATMLIDEFNQARQIALTKNRAVEVRIYQLPKKTGGATAYRAFRTFLSDGTDPANSKPLGKVKYLPESTVISDSATFSTLLDYGNSNRSGLSHSQENFPSESSPVPYVSFFFVANGGTNLTPVTGSNSNWFLTLYLEDAEKNATTHLPSNYYNIQIDPVTGRVRSYRP